MLTSLHVEGFRGLQSLSVERLARINLFVGMNQSGKTSLLDAIQIFLDRGHPRALNDCQARRNERFVVRQHDDGSATVAPRLDTLFHGAKLSPGARIRVAATTPQPIHVDLTVEATAGALPRVRGDRPISAWAEQVRRLAIRVQASDAPSGVLLPIPYDEPTLSRFHNNGLEDRLVASPIPSPDFVDVAGLDPARLTALWSEAALTPREEQLVTALRIVEPALEGLRLVQGQWPGSTEFLVKLRDLDRPLHLGDMGEGFRRMLGLLLALPGTPRHELLVDEIDTGLHHSVLTPMWQLVLAEAKRRDLQVFATTHSWDCVAALGKLHEQDPGIETEISLHRIDRARDKTTSYGADEIGIAARRHIEVRG
jgi:hypothetical protein